jgi:2-polyprenyl-3-methyl-5-hydroxy-6-metoxy-1,4-benzoquinol methylase
MTDDTPFRDEQSLEQSRQLWNAEAASFDDAPDHGLRDPIIRSAWTNLLRTSLPERPGEVLDIGCGTGSLSLILAELGYTVTGIDFAPQMIAQAEAKAKAADQPIQFHVMDAAFPKFAPQQFDAIVCRHLLWTLPEPIQVLQRWVNLLKPKGRLLLIEGFWHTGVGLHSQEVLDILPPSLTNVVVQPLGDQPELWGGDLNDERFLVKGDRQD